LLRRLTALITASTLDFTAGQEYHDSQCLSSPYRELPDTRSNFYRSTVVPPNADQKIIGEVWSFRKRCHGAVATVAYAHHNSNGKVFDEWVFNFQGTKPIHRINGKQVKGFMSLHLFPHLKAKL